MSTASRPFARRPGRRSGGRRQMPIACRRSIMRWPRATRVEIGQLRGHVIDVSGHTIGHIAYHFPEADAVFTADSLMALGCGRLFEGTADQMWASLLQTRRTATPDAGLLRATNTPPRTPVFALTIEPGNPALRSRAEAVAAARAEGRPTVPSSLTEELATKPFPARGRSGHRGASRHDGRRSRRRLRPHPQPQGRVLKVAIGGCTKKDADPPGPRDRGPDTPSTRDLDEFLLETRRQKAKLKTMRP